MLYSTERRRMREVFFSAWRKHRAGEALEGAEALVVVVANRHPEYHRLLDDADTSAERDWDAESGESNPFMHLGLHIAIEEQLAIDQPPGIRAHYQRLCLLHGDEHAAQHQAMECLAEMLWQAGRAGQAPDPAAYLDCLGQRGAR